MNETLIPNQSGKRVYIQTEAGVCIAGEAIQLVRPRYFGHGNFYSIRLYGPHCEEDAVAITQNDINDSDSYEMDELATEVVKAIALAASGNMSDAPIISAEECVSYAEMILRDRYAEDHPVEVIV